jgi:hypothetical protein
MLYSVAFDSIDLNLERIMSRELHCLLAVVVCFLTAGCQPSQIAESKIASSEKNVAASLTAFMSGDVTTAEQTATQAIEGGGLPADLFVQALMIRAAARGILGSYDNALADLDQAAQGAGDMDKVHALRSLILTAKGDPQGSAAELAKAKQINRNVKVPADLKKWDFSN